jgi:nucleoside-diphosphate-sugar epimerase
VKRVLVTGATGFIGQHLCGLLLDRGYTVRGTFRQRRSVGRSDMEWVRVDDVGPTTDWAAALEGVDGIVHLAAMAHRTDGSASPADYMRTNVEGTRRLAEVAASSDARRLVFVSSIGAVRSFADEPLRENQPCQPDSDYGRSKRGAEGAIAEVLQGARLDWCVLRPVLVYGPGNPANMARLLRLVASGVPLPLASIRNRRSLLFVTNLTDVIERCLTHAAASRKTFHVADAETFSTPDLLRTLARHAGRRARLVPCPVAVLRQLARLGDFAESIRGRPVPIHSYAVERLTGSLVVEIDALRELLDWRPPFTAEEGLAATVNAFAQTRQ